MIRKLKHFVWDSQKKFLSHFDYQAFVLANPDLKKLSKSELKTFLRKKGLKEIRKGHRRFHWSFIPYSDQKYLEYNPDVRSVVRSKKISSPFEHFMRYGYHEILQKSRAWPNYHFDTLKLMREIIESTGLFNESYYSSLYPDVVQSRIDALDHYILFGGFEGRNPNDFFDSEGYLNRYPEVKQSGLNPLVHYILVGQKEGRSLGRSVGIDSMPELRLEKLPIVPPELRDTKEIEKLKIAVVVHAFYIDILEDIISAIDNIYPRPDLFISVSESVDVDEVGRFLKEHGYKKYIIKKVPNRGRDVGPFLIEFSDAIKSYDLCCKIHGKKSLYAGKEQTQWRNHLYHNLLGGREIVDDIVHAFAKDEKLGLLFSDNYGMIPYWGYTWLTNRPKVPGLLKKLKLESLSNVLEKSYIDYPAGTMFWFRPPALKQILDADFSYQDFPEEPIPNDGTIAHTLERLLAYTCRVNDFDFIEQNWKREKFSRNICHKNFNQLEAKNLATAKRVVDTKEYILFDIFDTFLTRTTFYPDNLFRILEYEIDKKFSIRSDFMRKRKEAESRLRQQMKPGQDVGYDEIYKELKKSAKLSEEIVKYAFHHDFHYELNILKPKKEVIELLHYARRKGKKILFVSDMYLNKKHLCEIMGFNGIDFHEEEIFVSSDSGYRKDNTTIWKYLIEQGHIDPKKSLMIGDNEVSDAKIPGDFSIESFHLMSERTLFFESPLGKEFRKKYPNFEEADMILLGPVINNIFESPFDLKKTFLDFNLKLDPYRFGYNVFAPFFYLFLENLYSRHHEENIFFMSRDGYFIKQLYEHYLKSKNLKHEGEVRYLEISRRVVLGAVEKDAENLKNIILDLGTFKGRFSELIHHRIGLDEEFLKETGIKDFDINDEEHLTKAWQLLTAHLDIVNHSAKHEREALLTYLNNIGFFKGSNSVLVDLGYSGTIQNYLYKITSQKLEGEYFVTTEKASKVENENSKIYGFFGNCIPFDDMKYNTIYKYSLILESYLVSDRGQLVRFLLDDGEVIPQYKNNAPSIRVQSKITEGVEQYIDAMSIVPVGFLDITKLQLRDISTFMFEYVIKHRLIDQEVLEIFHLEDDFTGKSKLNVIEILESRGL